VITRTLRCISVITHPEAEEAVSEALFRLFGTGAVIWHNLETGESRVSVYVELAQEDLTKKRRELRAELKEFSKFGLQTGSLKTTAHRVKPEDWAESWKRHFKPIEIGDDLLIKPSWSKRKPRAGAKVIILDPGLSFGTGQHPTTSYCLEQLATARVHDRHQSFLDIGIGTGVLAIAAAKLGYEPVQGFDFDPVAVRIANENADLNLCSSIELWEQDLMKLPVRSKEKFDVICANLIYDVLIAGQQRIINRLNKNGRLILAGILSAQFAQVTGSYRTAGLRLMKSNTEGEWTSGTLQFGV
jgi:ribosomal protein L11 methyltransferase